MNNEKLEFGQILKRIRTTRNLTVRKFASKVELSIVYISDLENNNRKVTMTVINKIIKNILLTEIEQKEIMDAFCKDRLNIPTDLLYYLLDNDLLESLKIIKDKDKTGENIKQLALKLNLDK